MTGRFAQIVGILFGFFILNLVVFLPLMRNAGIDLQVLSALPMNWTREHDSTSSANLTCEYPKRTEFSVNLRNITISYLLRRVANRILQSKNYLNALPDYSFNEKQTTSLLSYAPVQGGMGNWLFPTAAFLGLARKNHYTPVVIEDTGVSKFFPNFQTLRRMSKAEFTGGDENNIYMSGGAPGIFESNLYNISGIRSNKNAIIVSYLQSWKYFHDYRDYIRAMLTFNESIFQAAIASLNAGLQNVTFKNFDELPLLVGIHVRRGDMVDSKQQTDHGHRAATDEYLLRVIKYYQDPERDVIFVVISNDMPYCRKLFRGGNFLFIERNSAEVDMALFSLMDKLILTVGTYGWWGAYMSDADEVIYFSDWPRKGSDMFKLFNHKDYFLPWWVAST